MSFADTLGGRGGGGPAAAASSSGYGTSSSSAGDGTFDAESRAVASAIFQMTTNVTSFKRLVDALGTPKDTRDLRARLHRQRDALGQIAKDTTAAVKRLSELAAGAGPAAKATQTKLLKDFQAVLKEFQRAQRACAERESSFLPGGAPGDGARMGAAAAFDGVTGSYQRSESIEKARAAASQFAHCSAPSAPLRRPPCALRRHGACCSWQRRSSAAAASLRRAAAACLARRRDPGVLSPASPPRPRGRRCPPDGVADGDEADGGAAAGRRDRLQQRADRGA